MVFAFCHSITNQVATLCIVPQHFYLCCSIAHHAVAFLFVQQHFSSCCSNFFAPSKKELNFVHGSSEAMLAIATSCTGSVISHRDDVIFLPQGWLTETKNKSICVVHGIVCGTLFATLCIVMQCFGVIDTITMATEVVVSFISSETEKRKLSLLQGAVVVQCFAQSNKKMQLQQSPMPWHKVSLAELFEWHLIRIF